MKDKTIILNQASYDFDYFFGFIINIVNLVLIVVLVIFIMKLYKALMNYLKK
jgi:hypothetical protein